VKAINWSAGMTAVKIRATAPRPDAWGLSRVKDAIANHALGVKVVLFSKFTW
jgi:hypothetical protein